MELTTYHYKIHYRITMAVAFAPERCTSAPSAISELYAMKYEVERMGGEFRGYSEAYRKNKQQRL